MTEERFKRRHSFFVASADVEEERITSVEGIASEGLAIARPLLTGERMFLFEWLRPKGLVDPLHTHDDHESIGYLIKGKLRLVVGGEEFIAEPGSAWIHPAGVEHSSEALEDCLEVTVKSPPRKPWASE